MASSCREYKGAIALNNIGVALLERREHRAALSTFRDALFIMKQLATPRLTSSNSPDVLSREALSTSLHRKLLLAMRRLARPGPVVENMAPVCILPRFDADIPGLKSALFQDTATSTKSISSAEWIARPLRIDDAQEAMSAYRASDDESSDSEIRCAVVMYNFGVANLCMARETKDDEMLDHLLRNASAVFRAAESVLLHPEVSFFCEKDAILDMRRLLVAAMLLNTSTAASMAQGSSFEAKRVCHKLRSIKLAIQELEEDPQILILAATSCTLSAPAA